MSDSESLHLSLNAVPYIKIITKIIIIIKIIIIFAEIYIAPLKRHKEALHMSVRTKQKRKEFSSKQDRNKQQGGALTEATGLQVQSHRVASMAKLSVLTRWCLCSFSKLSRYVA